MKRSIGIAAWAFLSMGVVACGGHSQDEQGSTATADDGANKKACYDDAALKGYTDADVVELSCRIGLDIKDLAVSVYNAAGSLASAFAKTFEDPLFDTELTSQEYRGQSGVVIKLMVTDIPAQSSAITIQSSERLVVRFYNGSGSDAGVQVKASETSTEYDSNNKPYYVTTTLTGQDHRVSITGAAGTKMRLIQR
jgi:hypothetical protein